jgi:hypothetical protein
MILKNHERRGHFCAYLNTWVVSIYHLPPTTKGKRFKREVVTTTRLLPLTTYYRGKRLKTQPIEGRFPVSENS